MLTLLVVEELCSLMVCRLKKKIVSTVILEMLTIFAILFI